MTESEFETAKADDGAEGEFFRLVYNERLAPAADWFGDRGWLPSQVWLVDYFREIDRPVPAPDSDAGPMFAGIGLVNAVKRPSAS
jgi:hypothetical protein